LFKGIPNSPLDSDEQVEVRLQLYPEVFIARLREGDVAILIKQHHDAMERNVAYVDGVLSKILTGSDLSKYQARINFCREQLEHLKVELDKAAMGFSMSLPRCVASMTFLEAYLQGLVRTVQALECDRQNKQGE
jgi:hypothetical protein